MRQAEIGHHHHGAGQHLILAAGAEGGLACQLCQSRKGRKHRRHGILSDRRNGARDAPCPVQEGLSVIPLDVLAEKIAEAMIANHGPRCLRSGHRGCWRCCHTDPLASPHRFAGKQLAVSLGPLIVGPLHAARLRTVRAARIMRARRPLNVGNCLKPYHCGSLSSLFSSTPPARSENRMAVLT
jgi:hypothetical protein